MGKIILNFPLKTPREEKARLTDLVNTHLKTIHNEVNSWNGFVDVIKNAPEEYRFIGNCDNEEVRGRMQELLDNLLLVPVS